MLRRKKAPKSTSTPATPPVLSRALMEPVRMHRRRGGAVVLAAMLMPMLTWQFTVNNFQYGWVFFALFGLSIGLLTLPAMAIEVWLSGGRKISLRGLAVGARENSEVGIWVYGAVIVLMLTLGLLMITLLARTFLLFDDIVAISLYDHAINNADELFAWRNMRDAARHDNPWLIVFWAVFLGGLLLLLVGRTTMQGSFRWMRILLYLGVFALLLCWFLWLDVLSVFPANLSGADVQNGMAASANAHVSAISPTTTAFELAMQQWLISRWPSWQMLQAAMLQALLVGSVGLGVWVVVRAHSGQILPDNFSSHKQQLAIAKRGLRLASLQVGLGVAVLYLLLSLAIVWLNLSVLSYWYTDVWALVTEPQAMSGNALAAHLDVTAFALLIDAIDNDSRFAGVAFAVAWTTLLVLLALTTLLAWLEPMLNEGRNRRWRAALVLTGLVTGAAILAQQNNTQAVDLLRSIEFVLAVMLPLCAWVLITIAVRRLQLLPVRHRLKWPLWYLRFPLRIMLVLIVLLALGVGQWFAAILRL